MPSGRIIDSGKTDTIISEGYKFALDVPAGSLTPSTITAAIGIAKNQALKINSEVTGVISKLSSVSTDPLSPNFHPLAEQMQAAASSLSTQANMLMSSNADFGQMFTAAAGHIKSMQEMSTAMEVISNTGFADIAGDVTNLSSSLDQGLLSKFGSPSDLVTAMGATGGLFSFTDMSKFGTSAGLIEGLTAGKLANSTGLNAELAKFGVDTNQLTDPAYATQIDAALSSIKDPTTIKTIADQYGIPSEKLQSLKDFTDVQKLTGGSIPDFGSGLGDIGQKLGDLGASFNSGIMGAAGMIQNLEVPSLPKLDQYGSLDSMMSELAGDFTSVSFGSGFSGTGSGPGGMPNMTDFFGAACGNPATAALASADLSQVTSGMLNNLSSSLNNSTSLLSAAGIGGSSFDRAASSLSSSLGFAASLHTFGADDLFADPAALSGLPSVAGNLAGAAQNQFLGATDVLKKMANTDSKFGEAIIASLAEGKNKMLMGLNGIAPPEYTVPPVTNPFESLPTGKDAQLKFIPNTGKMSPEQISALIGGGA